MPATIIHELSVDLDAVREICQRFGVRWLAVFGSVARGESRPESDVDVLYELRPGRPMGYFELERLAGELSPIFGGRYVDIARPAQIHWYIRDSVMAEAKVLYEE